MQIILELSEAELEAIAKLIDAGVRAAGIQSVKDAAMFLAKAETAKREAHSKQHE
jgi:hypothetical protein